MREIDLLFVLDSYVNQRELCELIYVVDCVIGTKYPCLRLVGELVVMISPLVIPPMPVTLCGLIRTPVNLLMLRLHAIVQGCYVPITME